MLQSILHAARLRFLLSNAKPIPSFDNTLSTSQSLPYLLKETQRWTDENFPGFKAGLERSGWRTDEIGFADHGRRITWRSLDNLR